MQSTGDVMDDDARKAAWAAAKMQARDTVDRLADLMPRDVVGEWCERRPEPGTKEWSDWLDAQPQVTVPRQHRDPAATPRPTMAQEIWQHVERRLAEQQQKLSGEIRNAVEEALITGHPDAKVQRDVLAKVINHLRKERRAELRKALGKLRSDLLNAKAAEPRRGEIVPLPNPLRGGRRA